MSEYVRWASFTSAEVVVLLLALAEIEEQDPSPVGGRLLREVRREADIRGGAARVASRSLLRRQRAAHGNAHKPQEPPPPLRTE